MTGVFRPDVAGRRAVGVAALMALCALVLVASTDRMGYTRDESFYFRFAEVYHDWLVAAGGAPEGERGTSDRDPWSREGILAAWGQNAEHPPLVKVLMGATWRSLGRMERPASTTAGPARGRKRGVKPEEPPSAVELRVTELRVCHGFAVGDEVRVLGPQAVGQDAGDSERRIALGRVTSRTPGMAKVEVRGPGADQVARYCMSSEPQKGFVRGCSVEAPGLLREGAAMRFVGPLFTALLVFAMVLFGWHALHPAAGVLAPILFLATPRWFFHAHLAAFDMPVTAMVFLVSVSFWLSLERPRWVLPTALLWGLSLLTKHNGLFLPVPLVLFWLLAWRREISLRLETGGLRRWLVALAGAAAVVGLGRAHPAVAVVFAVLLASAVLGLRLRLPRVPLAFLVMPPIGLLMLFLFWPRLWVDPFIGLENWLRFHLGHEHYMQYYFGRVLEVPPFPVAFPFMMTLLTVPALTLVVSAVGLFDLARPWLAGLASRLARRPLPVASPLESVRARVGLFLVISALFPVVLIALPKTPIFGGVKHWMPGMPFFCLIGAWGIVRCAAAATALLGSRRPLARAAATAVIALGVLAPAAAATARSTAAGNGHYNELIGGISGAADHKLTRLYWGHSSLLAFDHVNRVLPTHARVWFHDTTYDAYWMYRREGRLRRDIAFAHGVEVSDAALFEEQKFFAAKKLEIKEAYNVPGPVWSWRLEGVPIISLYAKPGYLAASALPESESRPAARGAGAPPRVIPRPPIRGPAKKGPGKPAANQIAPPSR